MTQQWFRFSFNRLAPVLAGCLLLAACGTPEPDSPLDFGDPLPSPIAPVPDQPEAADEGLPGTWQRLPGVEPPARVFFVGPETGENLPSVILVHSRWGINRDTRDLARNIAASGMLVAAPDLYEGIIARHRISVSELTLGVDRARAADLIGAAAGMLAADPRAADLPPTLFGSAVGGRWALEALAAGSLAPRALLLDSTSLEADDFRRVPEAKLVLLCGQANSAFPPGELDRLRSAAGEAGAELAVVVFEGAGTDLFDPRATGYSEAIAGRALREVVSRAGGSLAPAGDAG